MGTEAYLTELGLSNTMHYDAQRNSFDPQAVDIMITESIRQWSNGEGPPRHEYEPPSRVQMVFQTIGDYTRARGLPAVESPFPYDLRGGLLTDQDGADPKLSSTPGGDQGEGRDTTTTMTAGNGRGGQ